MENAYYQKVNDYYNFDTKCYEDKYYANATYQNIRNNFRAESENYPAEKTLEIGFGTGIDLIYFAKKYPESKFYGIDVSKYMNEYASEKIAENELTSIEIAVGSVENIGERFPNQKFDKIHVFFGALNTVENIEDVQAHLKNALTDDGVMMLTFVNKWYMLGMLKPMVKFKFKESRQRLGKVWRGYSPNKFIKSRCYTSREIKKYFNQFELVKKRGFSILYPAWYENNINLKRPKMCRFFWKVDQFLQKTPFWNLGEYSLYVFKKKA